jgi:hypothetical protein
MCKKKLQSELNLEKVWLHMAPEAHWPPLELLQITPADIKSSQIVSFASDGATAPVKKLKELHFFAKDNSGQPHQK